MTWYAPKRTYALILWGSLFFLMAASLPWAAQAPATSPASEPHAAPPAAGGHTGGSAPEHKSDEHKAAGHKGWGVWDTVGKVINFLILAAVLGIALKGPIRQFIAQRGEDIQRKLAEAQRARDEAQAKLTQVQQTMARLDSELQAIKAQTEKDAAAERQRIVQTAEEDAAKVLAMARREIDNLMRSARGELKGYAAELTVGLAEEMLKRDLNPEDDRKVFMRFIDNLKSRGGSVH